MGYRNRHFDLDKGHVVGFEMCFEHRCLTFLVIGQNSQHLHPEGGEVYFGLAYNRLQGRNSVSLGRGKVLASW